MPTWINALGACGFGAFYGYVAIYIMKRYLPPISPTPPKIKEIVVALIALTGGGAMGALVRSVDRVNYMGPYGIGILIGAAANTAITIWLGTRRV